MLIIQQKWENVYTYINKKEGKKERKKEGRKEGGKKRRKQCGKEGRQKKENKDRKNYLVMNYPKRKYNV